MCENSTRDYVCVAEDIVACVCVCVCVCECMDNDMCDDVKLFRRKCVVVEKDENVCVCRGYRRRRG